MNCTGTEDRCLSTALVVYSKFYSAKPPISRSLFIVATQHVHQRQVLVYPMTLCHRPLGEHPLTEPKETDRPRVHDRDNHHLVPGLQRREWIGRTWLDIVCIRGLPNPRQCSSNERGSRSVRFWLLRWMLRCGLRRGGSLLLCKGHPLSRSWWRKFRELAKEVRQFGQ